MSQRAPYACLLAVRFCQTNTVVGEISELLDHKTVFVGIFIGADMKTLPSEHRFVSSQIFHEKRIDEIVCLILEKVEVVAAIILAA